MKKLNAKAFSPIEAILIVVVVGLLGGIGYYVYSQSQKQDETSSPQSSANVATTDEETEEDESATPEGVDYKTLGNIKYTTPSGWRNVKAPYAPYEVAKGNYLLSPGYKEAGGGQLSIKSGAFIYFEELEWVGIDSNTTIEQAANVVKNGEGGYLDTDSVKKTTVSGKQVIMFDSGHTTDGVSVLYKTANKKWLNAGFSTTTGNDGAYNSQESSEYKVFLDWLEEFVELN